MIDYVAIFTLLGVIVMLVADRFFIVEQHQKDMSRLLEELSKATKAVISKNANEYVMTTSIDKVASETKEPVNTDQVDPDSLSDDEFDESLGIKRSAPKN
jgi:hypothetical protein